MDDQILNCQYALNGKGIGRLCSKVEDRSCGYYGHTCQFDEKALRKRSENRVIFDDDDGEPQ